jgi:hypothetical protein
MNLKQIARAPKTDIHITAWHFGHIPRDSFPLSRVRNKHYKLGPEYRWRVITFDCLRSAFRILVVFNEGKQIYRATLAMERDRDLAVICQYEFHVSEPGWHCHVTFREVDDLPLGVGRSHLRRWPSQNVPPGRPEFGIRETNAVGVAMTRFRVSPLGDLGI